MSEIDVLDDEVSIVGYTGETRKERVKRSFSKYDYTESGMFVI